MDHHLPLIQLSRISTRFGRFVALNDVSLSIEEGEFLALLGPSGCGKTTLLRTIAGFHHPTSGDVLIEGRSVRNDPPNRRPVNIVFQNYALFPHMTVAENVGFGPKRHGIDRRLLQEKVTESLALVGMEDFAARHPSALSGGQQQRVALARAIINQPKVLLLDEPLAALDLKLRKRMQLELKRLQERLGITFVFVTHDQEEALVMADRIVVMSNGQIEQCGSGEHIYDEPETRFVADFIGEANLLECRLDAHGNLYSGASSAKLPYRAEGNSGQEITLMIRPERIRLGLPADSAEEFVGGTGTVRDVVYAGSVTRVYVESPLSPEIVIALPQGIREEPVGAGQRISFSWHRDDARVLMR